MTSPTDVLSLAASAISAVGGLLAAGAAFRSAESARQAQRSADTAELRASLRELATTAGAVLVEERRVQELAAGVSLAHRMLATLSGISGGSRLDLYLEAVSQRANCASELASDAKLFADGATSLQQSTPEEIDRVLLRQTNSLRKVIAMREDLDREHASLEAQCAHLRESADRARIAT